MKEEEEIESEGSGDSEASDESAESLLCDSPPPTGIHHTGGARVAPPVTNQVPVSPTLQAPSPGPRVRAIPVRDSPNPQQLMSPFVRAMTVPSPPDGKLGDGWRAYHQLQGFTRGVLSELQTRRQAQSAPMLVVQPVSPAAPVTPPSPVRAVPVPASPPTRPQAPASNAAFMALRVRDARLSKLRRAHARSVRLERILAFEAEGIPWESVPGPDGFNVVRPAAVRCPVIL